MECRLLAVHPWDLGPQLMGTVATAIPDVKGNNLAGCSIVRPEKSKLCADLTFLGFLLMLD
jgi:hypothetical protein